MITTVLTTARLLCSLPAVPLVPCARCTQLLRDIESRQLDMTGPLWAGVSDEARQMVGLMLLRDSQLRPSARQLLTAFSGWLDLGRLA